MNSRMDKIQNHSDTSEKCKDLCAGSDKELHKRQMKNRHLLQRSADKGPDLILAGQRLEHWWLNSQKKVIIFQECTRSVVRKM